MYRANATKDSIFATPSINAVASDQDVREPSSSAKLPNKAMTMNAMALCMEKPNTQVRGTGAPQVRRAPTKAMKMPKAWPLLGSP